MANSLIKTPIDINRLALPIAILAASGIAFYLVNQFEKRSTLTNIEIIGGEAILGLGGIAALLLLIF